MSAVATLPDKIVYVEHGKELPFSQMFPEYDIINNALRGGYSWYDLMHDRGRHLIEPKYRIKVVYVSKEELVECKKRQAIEEAAEKERERAAEAARMFPLEVNGIVHRILNLIKELSPTERTQDALVDFVVARLNEYEKRYHDPVLERLCPLIESQNLITRSDEEQCARAVEALLTQVRGFDEIRREIDLLATFLVDAVDAYPPVLHTRILDDVVRRIDAEGLIYTPIVPLPAGAVLVSRRVISSAPRRSRYEGWLSPQPAAATATSAVEDVTVQAEAVPLPPLVVSAVSVTAPSTPEQPLALPNSPASTHSFATADIDNEDLSSFVTALEGDEDAWGIPRLDLSAAVVESTPAPAPAPAPAPILTPTPTPAAAPAVLDDDMRQAFVTRFQEVLATLSTGQVAKQDSKPLLEVQGVQKKFLAKFQEVAAFIKPKASKMTREEARRRGRERKAAMLAAAAASAPAVETKPLFDPAAFAALPVIQTKLVKAPVEWRASKLIAPRSKSGAWYYDDPAGVRHGPLTQSEMADWILAVYFD